VHKIYECSNLQQQVYIYILHKLDVGISEAEMYINIDNIGSIRTKYYRQIIYTVLVLSVTTINACLWYVGRRCIISVRYNQLNLRPNIHHSLVLNLPSTLTSLLTFPVNVSFCSHHSVLSRVFHTVSLMIKCYLHLLWYKFGCIYILLTWRSIGYLTFPENLQN